MRTAWINRSGGPYPGHFAPPDLVATGVSDLAAQLSIARDV
jgi:2-haloacid dehalogenase